MTHRPSRQLLCLSLVGAAVLSASQGRIVADTGVHTTYLWHMHQPIYWPDESTWEPGRYETAYETITLGHSQNDVFSIFNSDDRVGDYQWYPRDAISSITDLPQAGAQVSFAGSLIENIFSLGDNNWNGGRYAADWYSPYREARGWINNLGQPRLEPVLVGFHHGILPLMDDNAVRMELACQKAIYDRAWGDNDYSGGAFPAEMCFSERLIPLLIEAGAEWVVVPDIHIARACADYPYQADQDNNDPPNAADQINPAQGDYTSHFIPRGVTVKVPYPYGFTPHRARYVDPGTGLASQIVIVPMANAMSWDEGYGMYGTGDIDAIAPYNDPANPMLILFAHDGDNAWSGGHSYYYENVTSFSHQAAGQGYTPTTVASYLAQHPVPPDDFVHVEDGGWVNADGDFGSPQFINWNWPLVNQSGAFDIPTGWATDERNWAVLTAAQNRVETAAEILGGVDPEKVVDPLSGANAAEGAWHFLLAGYESGYMYYGDALDMEVKASIACNEAVALADPVIAGGADTTPPTVWLPQRLPWNPGGFGGGSLWGYPGGDGAPMSAAFHVWTFAYDVSGLARVELMIREDADGLNDPGTDDNETYAGGSDVGSWLVMPMNFRDFPDDEPWEMGNIDFFELPAYIADQYWLHLTDYSEVLLDYFVEVEDNVGNIKRTPLQHVYVGTSTGGGYVMDGSLDGDIPVLASGENLTLWGQRDDSVLYLACEGTGETSDWDHFLLVLSDTSAVRAAPWAKAGNVREWDYYLAAEDDNGWTGWFDSGESVQNSGEFAKAQGAVLEGMLDLEALYGASPPDPLWIAAAAYETPDGGALSGQAPAGDADGDLSGWEFYPLSAGGSAVPDDPDGRPAGPELALSLSPTLLSPRTSLALTCRRACDVRVDMVSADGRIVATLHDGPLPAGVTRFDWHGDGNRPAPLSQGIYFFRACGNGETAMVRGLLLH